MAKTLAVSPPRRRWCKMENMQPMRDRRRKTPHHGTQDAETAPRTWRKLDSRRWLSSDGRLIFRRVHRLLSGGMTVTFTLYRTDRMHPTNELGTYYKISEAKEVE